MSGPRPLRTVDDKVVVVTGAGSGIGRALAVRAAAAGAHLALSDRDGDGLAATVDLAERAGARAVGGDVVDVADRVAMAAWAASVVDRHGRVELVVNNAGVTLTGDVESMGYDDFEWIVGINLMGVVHGTKEFLPHLIASGRGALVNVSSLFGLVSVPGQSAYNATKYAVRGFTEALREEMIVNRHPVTVSCVHPGGVRTGISRNGRKNPGVDAEAIDRLFDKIASMSPDRAARVILDGALRGSPRILVGLDAHAIHQFARLVGPRYQDVVARLTPVRRLPPG